MNRIENTFFEGERPLFASLDTEIKYVKFFPGESAVKESSGIRASHCEFMGKYPFWHNKDTMIDSSLFSPTARAAIWYCTNVGMVNTRVEAPKMFREVEGLYVEKVQLTDAMECGWYCRNVEYQDVDVGNGDYFFKNSEDIRIENLSFQGNYGFQYCRDVEIRNSLIQSKDAFWNTEDVTIYDSVIRGEYLGWHSKNLRLVNCVISGTQPLCYARNLRMENCILQEDADLAFEYSTLNAEINSSVTSVKNPRGGEILARSIGEIILDENCKDPGACKITVENEIIA